MIRTTANPVGRFRRAALPLLLLVLAGCGSTSGSDSAAAPAAAPPIPRAVLFGNPERVGAQISPDGRHLSWIAPYDGVLNVWVAPVDDAKKARALTRDTGRGIRSHVWAWDDAHLLYLVDRTGDENAHLFAVDVATGTSRDLTPIEGVRASIVRLSRRVPDQVLVGLNDRDARWHDVHRVRISDGARELVQKNEGFGSFLCDDRLRVRLGQRPLAEGGEEYLEPDGSGGWRPFFRVPADDDMTTWPLGYNPSGRLFYLVDSRGRDTSAVIAKDLITGETKVIAESPDADVGDVLMHPEEDRPQAAVFTRERDRWVVSDPSIEGDVAALRGMSGGEFRIVSRTRDDDRWIVLCFSADGPSRTYLWDRRTRNAEFLFTDRPALEKAALARVRPVEIPASDGLKLVSYLTLPAGSDPDGDGRPGKPLPLVLDVHGGPWGRDSWGFSPKSHWLADRGYAVLNVNFRGSTGFGKSFVNAGDKEWGAKMHRDLLDAKKWAVAQGITTPDRVAIMGGSYGGYAALVGMAFTPGEFVCGVDIVGPSNLVTLLQSFPAYWAASMETFARRVGDHRTDEGRKLLTERSPITKVDAIKGPLLIAHGANDPRVKQAESDSIAAALQTRGVPVVYALFPDEGHSIARPENRRALYALVEQFLAKHLGGRAEPVGDDLKRSSMKVPVGADRVAAFSEPPKPPEKPAAKAPPAKEPAKKPVEKPGDKAGTKPAEKPAEGSTPAAKPPAQPAPKPADPPPAPKPADPPKADETKK